MGRDGGNGSYAELVVQAVPEVTRQAAGATRRHARSKADLELADWIKHETDVSINPFVIERWRQRGLLQSAHRRFPGAGSEALYSAQARQQAVELARLSERYGRYDDIARVLFLKRLYVRESTLRDSFDRLLSTSERLIGPLRTEGDLDRLDAFAQRLARYGRRTKHGKSIQRRMQGAYSAAGAYYLLVHLLRTGRPTSTEGLTEFLNAIGVDALYSRQIGQFGPIAPGGRRQIERFLRKSTLPNVRALLETATWKELEEARDLVAVCFPFFRSIGLIASRYHGPLELFGMAFLAEADFDESSLASYIPFALVILPYTQTKGAQELLAGIRQHANYFEQMADFVVSIDPGIAAALAAGDGSVLKGLPKSEAERIRQAALSVQIVGRDLPWVSAGEQQTDTETKATK